MVFGMATKKITITLPADQLARIRDLVARGSAPSVSGFVQHAVNVSLQDVAGWGALLAEALEQSGGPLTKRERKWADSMLGARPARRRRAA
jgi:Arc/MetJ-type ribon-helix-helix transcriptional regulator